ncbi:DNA gyrase C-terminal beta-propeller domain-containing protein, partial [Clostridium cadaveris]
FVFFTKSGMIKKTFMKEFVGDFQGIPCYKFKEERDELVAVEYIKAPGGEALVITELGMAIRFPIDSVNSMGRIATGVTAISLKEEDKVMFGSVILNSYSDDDEISVTRDKSYVTIKTQYKEERNIDINFIKLQNRAGRGTSIMTIVMDDKIIKVDIA